MSSAETPDDREPPQFDFSLWTAQVAVVVICIVALAFALAYLREPRTSPGRIAAQKEHHEFMVRQVCTGELWGPPYYSKKLCKDFQPIARTTSGGL